MFIKNDVFKWEKVTSGEYSVDTKIIDLNIHGRGNSVTNVASLMLPFNDLMHENLSNDALYIYSHFRRKLLTAF